LRFLYVIVRRVFLKTRLVIENVFWRYRRGTATVPLVPVLMTSKRKRYTDFADVLLPLVKFVRLFLSPGIFGAAFSHTSAHHCRTGQG
jgi:hypothetical protein